MAIYYEKLFGIGYCQPLIKNKFLIERSVGKRTCHTMRFVEQLLLWNRKRETLQREISARLI
jgi:hypothetical protein